MNPISFSAQAIKPYSDAGLNKIYNLLFGDSIDLYKSETQSTDYPWNTLLSSSPEQEQLMAITADETLEARQKILAYNLLSGQGFPIDAKVLLGVVIEVGLDDGLDVLAAFNDGTCRYINHTERLLVWEDTNRAIEPLS